MQPFLQSLRPGQLLSTCLLFVLCTAVPETVTAQTQATAGNERQARQAPVPITAACWIPNASLILAKAGLVEVRANLTASLVRTLETDLDQVTAIAASADRSKVAVAGGTPAELGVVVVFDTKTWQQVGRIEIETDVISDLAWLDDEQLVVCDMTGDAHGWKIASRQVDWSRAVHSKAALAIARLTENQFVSCGADQVVRVWGDKPTRARNLTNHLGQVYDLAVKPEKEPQDHPLVVTASADKTVRFWQPTRGRMVRFVKLPSPPNVVIWSASGEQVIAGCQSGELFLVDPQTATFAKLPDPGVGWVHCLELLENETFLVGGVRGARIVKLPGHSTR